MLFSRPLRSSLTSLRVLFRCFLADYRSCRIVPDSRGKTSNTANLKRTLKLMKYYTANLVQIPELQNVKQMVVKRNDSIDYKYMLKYIALKNDGTV